MSRSVWVLLAVLPAASPAARADEAKAAEALQKAGATLTRGVVAVETRGYNQRGEEVCYFRRKVMVPKREAAKPRERPYTSAE